jgi:predicted enzyme related to lactoylglutathione lyase
MSTQTKTKPTSEKNNGVPASVVWFEIPADNVNRARTFYGKLFGWKIEKFPGPKPY